MMETGRGLGIVREREGVMGAMMETVGVMAAVGVMGVAGVMGGE